MKKRILFIIFIICIILAISICNVIYAKYIWQFDYKFNINSLPFLFEVEYEKDTFQISNNKVDFSVTIKNNNGNDFNKTDTEYQISLEGNEKLALASTDVVVENNTMEKSIGSGKIINEVIPLTILQNEGAYLGVKENVNLIIKALSPYSKTIEIPLTIENTGYIQDGLIVWYDGIENTRSGHNEESTVWENLIAEDNDGILKNINFAEGSDWAENSLILDGDDDWVQMKYLHYKNMTIEVVAKPLDIPNDQVSWTYLSNRQNGGTSIVAQYGSNLGRTWISSYKNISSENTIKLNQIYSMSHGFDGSNLYFSENGDYYSEAYSGSIGKPESSTVFAIGTNSKGTEESVTTNEDKAKIQVYSVRIYDRCLTQEEIMHNYNVDKERFNIEEITLQENPGYVQDGLVALYDGEKNTRYGHSQMSTVWNNLVSTDYDGTLTNFNFTEASGWTDNSLILDGSNDWVKLKYIYNAEMTVEIVAKPLSLVSNKKQFYLCNYQNGGLGIGKLLEGYNVGQIYVSSYKRLPSNNLTEVGKIYSMSSRYNGTTQYFRENEDIYTGEVGGKMTKPDSSTIFAIGTNPNGTSQDLGSDEARFNLEVYSVRIYNRCLTEDEVQYNYEIDKTRFGIE